MSQTCPKCTTPIAADALFCHRCGANFTVEMPVAPAAAEPAPTDAISQLRRELGDRYMVERELGRGGMATVYLAKDIKHDREVAIKVLLPELSASVGAERFTREIHLAAKLQHPNILGLYDSGTAGDVLYYVMPFVKGESLRDRLDREKMLPVDDAIAITLQVASALGNAHEHGIVHRDIKPENVLLTGGHALVADFGIARMVSEGGDRKLTQTGTSVGTPFYMAPEQASGDVVGPQADIYSMGCMLYEMLAGEPPFNGKNSMQIMARHAMEQVPSIRIVRSAVPEEVEEAIFAALGKAPADRPATAAKFAELLGLMPGATATMRTVRNTAMRRTPTGMHATMDAPQPLWRRPMAIGIAALLIVAVGAGVWKLKGGGARAPITTGAEAQRLAVLYFDDMSSDHSLGPVADGLTDGLIRSLSGGNSFTVISSAGASRFKGSTLDADSIARALRVGYLVRGQVEKAGDKITVGVRFDDASGVNLKRASFTIPATNLLAIGDSLSSTVALLVRQQLGKQIQLQQQRSVTDADAWLLLQRGLESKKEMEKAIAAGDSAGIDVAYRATDSLFAAAASRDAKWPDPVTQRGFLALRRARLTADPALMRPWAATATTYANAALAIDKNNADALELRGTVEYLGFIKNLETDPAKLKVLLAAAKADLQASTGINPNQAGALTVLVSLYYNDPASTVTDVVIAAQQAYKADEFQANMDLVLKRLTTALYDGADFNKMTFYCHEFERRFPADLNAARCRLELLTTKALPPDIPRAWRLADSVTALAPARDKELWRLNSAMLVAAVIARESKATPALADSARRVVKRSLGDAQIDPARDLALYGAIAYTFLGDKAQAVDLLKQNFAVNPQRAVSYRDDPGWQFADLKNDQDFKRLVGAAK